MLKQIVASFFVVLFLSAPAMAQDNKTSKVSDKISVNAGVTSDYRFRGISQNQGNPSLTGGIEYTDPSGIFLGLQGSTVSKDLYTDTIGMEGNVLLGYRYNLQGFTVEVGSMNYLYPGNSTFNTSEAFVGLGYGPLSVRASTSLTDSFGVADSRWSQYYEANLNYPISQLEGFSLLGHVGRTQVANNSNLNYTDWNAGLGYTRAGWTVAAKYYTNTNKGSGFESANTVNGTRNYKDAVVLSLSTTF